MSTVAVARTRSVVPEVLRVLIVDDSEPDVLLLSRMIRKAFGSRTEIVEAQTAREALELVELRPVDVALIDYRLPDMDGLAVLEQLGRLSSEAAVIVLTGQGNETVAAQAIKRGACDYLVKRALSPEVVEYAIRQAIELKRREASKSQTFERLEQAHNEMDHLVRSLSHDMNANFMVLESSFKQLKRSCDKSPLPGLLDGVSHVEACLKESKHFLDDLLALARTGQIDMEPQRVDVAQVVGEVLFELDGMFGERGARARVELGLPAVLCNRARFKQVVTNLVRNALVHGCNAERALIEIGPASPPPGARKAAAQVWLRIYDNGPGIPAEAREEIFLPGRRLAGDATAGSGMGLSIAKKIVEHYGGCIVVDPSCEQGTAFVFALPAA